MSNEIISEITDISMKLRYLNEFYLFASLKFILEDLKEGHGIGIDYAYLWFKRDLGYNDPDECLALLNDDKARHVILSFENPAIPNAVHMYISYELLYDSAKLFIKEIYGNDTELLKMLSEMKDNLVIADSFKGYNDELITRQLETIKKLREFLKGDLLEFYDDENIIFSHR